MAEIGLVIFDCDGVLVDSEPIAMRVLLAAIARAGVAISPDVGFRSYLGRSFATVAQSLSDRHGVSLSDGALDAMRQDLYAAFRAELKPMAGLLDVLPELEVPICVASSSQLERIAVSLDVTGLSEAMGGRVFSASMVEAGKPAPDLFLHAAAQMGVPPEACVVIEDSPAGIIAAKKAGMRVFAFTGGGHIGPSGLAATIAALKPDAMFADMRELPGLLANAAMLESPRPRRLVAVDVGTGSARAGVFTPTGTLLGRAECPIAVRRHGANMADHDSGQIWRAVCKAVREALERSGTSAEDVVGLSFDATCSLVVRGQGGDPLGVTDAEPNWDTITWFDHRALAEAEAITALNHPAVRSVGAVMSPEMQLPKLMWLKRHRPQVWAQMGAAYDLADFLCHMATGTLERSLCTLVTKWNWSPAGWPDDLLAALDLADLRQKARLPERPVPAGTGLGTLSERAAAELGLTTACVVAAGMVDAHAGALGATGAEAGNAAVFDLPPILVAGTSSSILSLAAERREIDGVWGPFADAVLPGTWLVEAGQSASGALLDALVAAHPAGGAAAEVMPRVLERLAELRVAEGWAFGRDIHVLPDFNGNRSPEADPRARGAVLGLSLDTDFDSLSRLYFRTAIGLALSLRHILDHLKARGFATAPLAVVGGHTQNPLLMDIYAAVLGVRLRSWNTDLTLLGTAMLAAHGAGLYGSVAAAGMAMQQPHVERPAPVRDLFARDYAIFLDLLAVARRAREG